MTEQAGTHRIQTTTKEKEIYVKWQLPGNIDPASIKRQICSLLATLLTEFPDRITMIDRKHREWTYKETETEEKFLKELSNCAIQIHPMRNNQQRTIRWIAITKIRTATTISDWKNNDQFYTCATEANAYVFPHPFKCDEWDIRGIGFIKNAHTIHYPKELLHDHITQLLLSQDPNPPSFQIIPQRITTTDKKASTKAYTIQCPKDSAKQLTHLLTHGPFRNESNHMFVPFRYKTSNPDIFLQCIRQQNDVFYKTWIIKLEGLTHEAMDTINPQLKNIKGIIHVVPSKRQKSIGEWKVLVEQSKCAYIHRNLTKEWKNLMARLPPSILSNAPTTYPSPNISSKKVREYQDSESDADSYGSLLSTGTNISQMTLDDTTLNELPASYQVPSYAAAASNMSTTSNQLSSPTVSTHGEWYKEKQDLEAQLKKQAEQIEKIQNDLQEKIIRSQDLEDQLAQALELAHSRDARHEEIMEKFERLMQRELQPPIANYELPSMTPDRYVQPPKSPPSKKANTNSSPHRNIYSVFRQQTARPQTGSTSTHTRQVIHQRLTPPPTSQQLMEIDDDVPTPPPGAKTGKKIE